MSNATHTPGPWRTIRWTAKESGVVATLAGNDSDICGYALNANAALIAAAPELLEALDGVLAKYTGLVESGDAGFWDAEKEQVVVAARAAIAKAKGGAA